MQQLNSIRLVLIFSFSVVLSGCGETETSSNTEVQKTPKEQQPEISFESLEPPSVQSAFTMFAQLPAEETGLEMTNELKPQNMRNYLINGAGVCSGDFDNDGLIDIFAVSQDGPNRLYRQIAFWEFEDVTQSAGNLSGGQTWGTGATFADVNNDGYLDLYVCNVDDTNELFINQKDGTFVEDAAARNVAYEGASTMASFADYDADGDLDLYLVNNRVFSIGEDLPQIELRMVNGLATVHPDFEHQYFLLGDRVESAGYADILFQNDGQGKFTDVTAKAGIAGFDMGLSATWWDYNNDGWLDLYVGNDQKTPDHLYENQGDGTFKDVIADAIGTTPWFSMGADAADINNDGRIDFLIADMSSTTHYKQKTTMGEMGKSSWFLTMGRPRQIMRNACYLNMGIDRLWEVAYLAGLDSTDWSWSIKFSDFDCDGWQDVFVTNGVGRNVNDSDSLNQHRALLESGKKEEAASFVLQMEPLREKNLVFRNLGNIQFEDATEKWGANHLGLSNGTTVADLDNDGDLDLVVSNLNEPIGVYRNDSAGGNRVVIRLRGTRSNRFGIGAKVTIQTSNGSQVRQLILARGYMSADAPELHFGIGTATEIDKLQVRWPSGTIQGFNAIKANHRITIVEPLEGETDSKKSEQSSLAKTLFRESFSHGLNYVHEELEYDDYQLQPLLPNKLSNLGPGMAWGDINDDGLPDCYIGGAASCAGKLFVQNSPGQYKTGNGEWARHLWSEDTGALFFDADSDGDQDLYVVSGGVEAKTSSPEIIDRLYLNNGDGGFQSAGDDALPKMKRAGSCVTGADYDRDGDIDLFVGTRLKRGQWPLAQTSYLLNNDQGVFAIANDDAAATLNDIGMVTGAVWSDVDDDGWIDLMLTLEWGAIKFLHNNRGVLVDQTESAGLADATGWWNGIAAGDLDSDGDIDFVATNFGLNTKYHASQNRPTQIFVNDFDENGRIDLVEAEWEGEVCFPIRGKSCSTHAMPFVSKKFPTYHEFALADLTDIYTDEAIEKSERFSATTLESVMLINDGQGRFALKSLPKLVQASPGFGVVIEDLDLDGVNDIFIAQNFYHAQPETGLMAGATSALLRGEGNGNFKMVEPQDSGIVVPEQAAGVAIVDVDVDGLIDLVVATNDGPLRVFLNQSIEEPNPFIVRLSGGGSPGASVVASYESGKRIRKEVYAGAGYLTQSTSELTFPDLRGDILNEFSIRWPDGTRQSVAAKGDQRRVTIEQSQNFEPVD